MRKTKTFRLAYLKDVSLDEIINKHIESVTSAKTRYDCVYDGEPNDGFRGESNARYVEVVVKKAKPAPRRAILLHKYKFLICDIIMRCRSSRENSVQLNYERYVSVIGKVFGDMMYTLKDLGIISLSTTYRMGQSSRQTSLLDWNIGFVDDSDIIVMDYFNRLDYEYQQAVISHFKELQASPFLSRYNKCLSRMDLVDKNAALEYVESRKESFATDHIYQYYKARIEDFDRKKLMVQSVDRNNRIYHYLTNLPKVLRCFFNLKCQLDIANSHPLLFSYFIINHYNISYKVISYLSSLEYKDICNYHNKGKQLRKLLKYNGIEVQDSRTLPNDILAYVFTVMKGRLWDDFVQVFRTLSRQEVKTTLFHEVFYSYSTTTRNRPFARQFAEIYPSVWHFVRQMKKVSRGNVSNKIQSFESKLMGAILRRCFEHNWCVVSIHDAVVVLDVEENNCLNLDELRDIMIEEYSKYGLSPTLSLDTFQ